jgi:hypothetical protein
MPRPRGSRGIGPRPPIQPVKTVWGVSSAAFCSSGRHSAHACAGTGPEDGPSADTPVMGGADVHNHRTLVGLDVHAKSTVPAVLDLHSGEVSFCRLNGPPRSVVNYLETVPGPVLAVYEAGPTGYGLAREAEAQGIEVRVCAPGSIPRKPGDRIRTRARSAGAANSACTINGSACALSAASPPTSSRSRSPASSRHSSGRSASSPNRAQHRLPAPRRCRDGTGASSGPGTRGLHADRRVNRHASESQRRRDCGSRDRADVHAGSWGSIRAARSSWARASRSRSIARSVAASRPSSA